jgi:hypothetical protein
MFDKLASSCWLDELAYSMFDELTSSCWLDELSSSD